MLSRRKNGRPFYEPVQERSDPELLSSECIDDIKRISDGLCIKRIPEKSV